MADKELPAEQIEIELDLAPGMEAEEDTLDRRRINTPSRQGANIPTGWKPTVAKPIPVVRCHYVWPDDHHSGRGGDRCNKWSLRGSRLCFFHGGRGNLKNVEEYRLAVIESARLQLIESAPDAVGVMLDLMSNGTAENVRLKAAESVLDRTGLKTADQLAITVDVAESNPAVTLAERLSKLKTAAETVHAKDEAAEAAAIDSASPVLALEAVAADAADAADAEVIEGEIVDE